MTQSRNSKRCVVVYSGGLDSTVLLYEMLENGFQVHPLSINYGQRHVKELDAARDNCKGLGLDLVRLDLPLNEVMKGSSQTDPKVEVPRGHYADATMKATVVPNRNMLLLALAGAHAISLKADTICYAAHAGDHTIYPDCRPEFVEHMRFVFHACHFTPIHLLTPFLYIKKSDIVLRGAKLGVDFSKTWSCYTSRSTHCGTCGTCTERREAFQVAGVPDPTVYTGA